MSIKWCHNSKTGEVFSYQVEGNLTDFPRGTFLAYGDYLTTGFPSKEEAEKAREKYFPCSRCKCSRSVKEGTNNCLFCGEKLIKGEKCNAKK